MYWMYPIQRVMLLLDARHGFKKKDIEFLELLYDPKGPSPLGEYALHALDHNFWHLMGHPEIRALILTPDLTWR